MRPLVRNGNYTAVQLVERLIRHLSPGFESKDRVVRYRCINIVSELLLHVNELQYAYLFLPFALVDFIIPEMKFGEPLVVTLYKESKTKSLRFGYKPS